MCNIYYKISFISIIVNNPIFKEELTVTIVNYCVLKSDLLRIKNSNIVNTHVLFSSDCSICNTKFNKHLFSLFRRYIKILIYLIIKVSLFAFLKLVRCVEHYYSLLWHVTLTYVFGLDVYFIWFYVFEMSVQRDGSLYLDVELVPNQCCNYVQIKLWSKYK